MPSYGGYRTAWFCGDQAKAAWAPLWGLTPHSKGRRVSRRRAKLENASAAACPLECGDKPDLSGALAAFGWQRKKLYRCQQTYRAGTHFAEVLSQRRYSGAASKSGVGACFAKAAHSKGQSGVGAPAGLDAALTCTGRSIARRGGFAK